VRQLRWDFGEAWVESADGTVLEYSTAWYSSKIAQKDENTSAEEGEPISEFRRQSEAFTFAPGIGLPGKVWSSRQPEWIRDVSIEPDTFFLRSALRIRYRIWQKPADSELDLVCRFSLMTKCWRCLSFSCLNPAKKTGD
jgi:hypothetical protein